MSSSVREDVDTQKEGPGIVLISPPRKPLSAIWCLSFQTWSLCACVNILETNFLLVLGMYAGRHTQGRVSKNYKCALGAGKLDFCKHVTRWSRSPNQEVPSCRNDSQTSLPTLTSGTEAAPAMPGLCPCELALCALSVV